RIRHQAEVGSLYGRFEFELNVSIRQGLGTCGLEVSVESVLGISLRSRSRARQPLETTKIAIQEIDSSDRELDRLLCGIQGDELFFEGPERDTPIDPRRQP